MRRGILILLVLSVCVVLSGCTGGDGGTLPTAEVSAVLDRIQQGVLTENSSLISSCFASSFESIDISGKSQIVTREQNKAGWDLVFALTDFSRYEIANRLIVFNGSTEAVVTGTVNVTSNVFGQWASSTSTARWTLRKTDGQWLIVKAEELM